MKMRVIGVGDNMCDKYYPDMIMYPGGQVFNFSVYAKLMGSESAYLGVFGTDREAAHVQAVLDEFGVDHSRCRIYDGENGCVKVRLVNGEREFIETNFGGVAKDHPPVMDDADIEYLKTFRLVYTSNNSHFDGQLSRLHDAGIPVAYDVAWHWEEEYYQKDVASCVDYVFMSCGDAPDEDIRKACIAFAANGVKIAIATRGSIGSTVYDGSDFYFRAAEKIEATDTLGAGDSYAATFLLSYLDNADIRTAMDAGSKVAARVCLSPGAYGHGVSFTDDI